VGWCSPCHKDLNASLDAAISTLLRLVVISEENFWHPQKTENIAAEILDEVRTRFRFQLIGYVFMPDHVHLLISEPLALECATRPARKIWRTAHPLHEAKPQRVGHPGCGDFAFRIECATRLANGCLLKN
jgi:hypothetical protein